MHLILKMKDSVENILVFACLFKIAHFFEVWTFFFFTSLYLLQFELLVWHLHSSTRVTCTLQVSKCKSDWSVIAAILIAISTFPVWLTGQLNCEVTGRKRPCFTHEKVQWSCGQDVADNTAKFILCVYFGVMSRHENILRATRKNKTKTKKNPQKQNTTPLSSAKLHKMMRHHSLKTRCGVQLISCQAPYRVHMSILAINCIECDHEFMPSNVFLMV